MQLIIKIYGKRQNLKNKLVQFILMRDQNVMKQFFISVSALLQEFSATDWFTDRAKQSYSIFV